MQEVDKNFVSSEQSNVVQSEKQKQKVNRPYVPKGSHPVETGRYLLATNEIVRLYEVVTKWIYNRTPGAIIYGRPRIGKTRAIDFLMDSLPEEFGERLPIFLINCKQYKIPSENAFYEDLLTDIGHQMAYKGKANQKRNRLINLLMERVDASGQSRLIFFMDDAQRLSEVEFGWLMDVYNELDRLGFSLTAILVGQDELLRQRSAFITSKQAQIIGRFMVHEEKFMGIKTLNDIKVCLSGYDHYSEYPVESGCSFTKYFFPERYEDGFRLTNYAADLFQVFNELRREAGLGRRIEIPMQYLTLTVEYCLRHFGVNGADVDTISMKQWEEAIKASGYITAELYQSMIPERD